MSDTAEVGTDQESAQIKGVYRTSWGNRWFAQIYRRGKRYYLGTYSSPEAAFAAYEAARLELDS
jgi:hypothetical protein